MKDPREWDEDYLYTLPIGEHSNIEAKRQEVLKDPKLEKVSKTLSAFANSGGGYLILGMHELSDRWQIVEGGIPLTGLFGKQDTREWLEHKLPNLVDKRLTDFDVYVIIRPSGREDSNIDHGKGVFVIDVRSSDDAPHQAAADHRYYSRSASDSFPMNHQQVMDVFNRQRHPMLGLELELWIYHLYPFLKTGKHDALPLPSIDIEPSQPPNRVVMRNLVLKLKVINFGKVLANYWHLEYTIPKDFVPNQEHTIEVVDGTAYVTLKANNYGGADYRRLLPGLAEDVSGPDLEFDSLGVHLDDLISWAIQADNAQTVRGSIKIKDIKRVGVNLKI